MNKSIIIFAFCYRQMNPQVNGVVRLVKKVNRKIRFTHTHRLVLKDKLNRDLQKDQIIQSPVLKRTIGKRTLDNKGETFLLQLIPSNIADI